ncbi:MAG: glycosyltransferase family 4 protein, partial [Actinomycetota bacterium]
VQTVHNYRHVCVAGTFFRDNRLCHDCSDRRVPWPAVLHGCYHQSPLQSASLGLSVGLHRSTWRLIDRFLPVGRSVARHLEDMGIDPNRITVRHNPVADPGPPPPPGPGGALFVGRLSAEKGAALLLAAWKRSGLGAQNRLRIAGDGPDAISIRRGAADTPGVELLGSVSHQRALELITESSFVVVPSLWEEPFGLAAVEALARGRPVVATNIGEPAHLIDATTGWIVEATEDALAGGLRAAFDSQLDAYGRAARKRYERDHSPGRALHALLDAYGRTIEDRMGSGR